ncbi:SbtR family transcriptional regulator [Rhodococcus wratislaviensis]|nr:hypothetical protein [Rhodococcus wratislaviensis]
MAAYEHEVDVLAGSAEGLLKTDAPLEAMRRWMWQYIDYVATKRGMAEVLRHVASGQDDFFNPTREKLLEAMRTLLDAGMTAGAFRTDVNAKQLFQVTTAVCLASDDSEWKEHSRKIMAVFLDGLVLRP